METLFIDFNDTLSAYLGPLPAGSMATREIELTRDGTNYRLIAFCQDNNFRLALWDEWGDVSPEFEVDCLGERLGVKQGEESVNLEKRCWVELAGLTLFLGGQPLCRLQIMPEPGWLTADEQTEAFSRRQAWQDFYRSRTCPPWEELRSGRPETAQHLETCPACREAVLGSGPNQAWTALARQLAATLPALEKPGIEPGQVWSLVNQLDGWDNEGRYLRAPQVLVLSTRGGIRTVFCCPEPDLAGPDDIFLDESLGFAEVWNPLVLPASVFRECWGHIDKKNLERVLNGQSRPLTGKGLDWRAAFETLERHVAQTMEQRALALEVALEARTSQTSGPSWLERIRNVLGDFFSLTRQDLVWAKGQSDFVPVMYYGPGGRVDNLKAEITDWCLDQSGLNIHGGIKLPQDAGVPLLFAWLELPDGQIVQASERDIAGRFFRLGFPPIKDFSLHQLGLLAVNYGG